jgi:hypothetical protein
LKSIIVILAVYCFFIAVDLKAESCFCKVLCFWNGEDSSDFYKVHDVSCDQTIEKQKEFANGWLMKHVKKSHPSYTERELKSKTEITCFKSKATNNGAPPKKSTPK